MNRSRRVLLPESRFPKVATTSILLCQGELVLGFAGGLLWLDAQLRDRTTPWPAMRIDAGQLGVLPLGSGEPIAVWRGHLLVAVAAATPRIYQAACGDPLAFLSYSLRDTTGSRWSRLSSTAPAWHALRGCARETFMTPDGSLGIELAVDEDWMNVTSGGDWASIFCSVDIAANRATFVEYRKREEADEGSRASIRRAPAGWRPLGMNRNRQIKLEGRRSECRYQLGGWVVSARDEPEGVVIELIA